MEESQNPAWLFCWQNGKTHLNMQDAEMEPGCETPSFTPWEEEMATCDRLIRENVGTKKGSSSLGWFHSLAVTGCKAESSKDCHKHILCNQVIPTIKLLRVE